MKSIGAIVGRPKAPHKYQGDSRLCLPTHCLGVEIEYEKVTAEELPDATWARFWQSVEDQSLHDHGREFVFNGPLFGSDALEAVVGLTQHAKAKHWASTARTGLHVHVDCRDLAPQQLAGMLVLYALYEPAIYRFVGEDRDQNVFCRPWYRCSGAVDLAAATVNAILETGDFERRWDSLVTNDDRRYAGLNLQSLGELGTVEWRQLKTTHDTARVVNWINIALGFKAAAYSIPASNITIVEDVRRMGANAYLAMYFPHQVTSLLAHSGLDVEVEELGMPVALDLMKSGTGAPWERAKLEKKPFKPAISYIEGRMKTAQAYEVVPKAAIDPTHATIMQQYQALYGGIDAPGATVGEWLTPTFVPHVPQQGVPNLGRAAATRRAAEAAAGARAAPLNVEEAYFARNNDVRGDNAR